MVQLLKTKSSKYYKTSITNNKISIEWEPTDQRTLKYKVIRTYGQHFNKQTNDYYIDENNFIDNDVSSGIEYTYEIFAIDQYGILSNSAEVSDIKIKK